MAVHAPQQMQMGPRHRPPFQGAGVLSSNPVPNFGGYRGVVGVSQESYGGADDGFSGFFGQRQELDAKRLRKSIYRKTVDYFTPVVKYLEERSIFVESSNFREMLGDAVYSSEILSCVGYPHNASNAITTKFIRQATNKIKCPVFVVMWTPEGRRLVTGSSSGEFTLWNGLTFNFETILQAHDTAVRSMVWSRSDTWLVTGDASGFIKYWQANMNNVKSYQAHRDSIRGISFCPTDFKFATGSDDGTIRIWDFETCETLKVLRGGHGGEVKCVDWHPKKSLLVTGSRDNQQPVKLWDPRTADAIGTLYLHKGPVTDLKWNPINSNYLLSSSRDSLVKLFDLRTMKDFQTCRGHKREVMSVAWHPIHQNHFCSGGMDGSLMFWNTGTEREVGMVENAHDGSIWSMSWHPQGHILCTGSNDCSVKFWTRNRPGDTMKDKYNARARNETDNSGDMRFEVEEEEEDLTTGDTSFGNFDNQDISEFEGNVARSRLEPNTSFQPPNQAPFHPQQYNPANSQQFPPPQPHFVPHGEPPFDPNNPNRMSFMPRGAAPAPLLGHEPNQFPSYDNRDPGFQHPPPGGPGFQHSSPSGPPPQTGYQQPPPGHQNPPFQGRPTDMGPPQFPPQNFGPPPGNFQGRPGEAQWNPNQNQPPANAPPPQQWGDRGPLLQPPDANLGAQQQPNRPPVQQPPHQQFPPPQGGAQPLINQPPNWDDRGHGPPPDWDRNRGSWQGNQRGPYGGDPGQDPHRGGLLPPPPNGPGGSGPDGYRGNKRPWDEQYSGDGDRDRQGGASNSRGDNDDHRGNWRGGRGGGRGGRGRGSWRGR